jgi:hypothetical protein
MGVTHRPIFNIGLWHYRTKENNYIESPNIQGGIAIDIYWYSKFNQGSWHSLFVNDKALIFANVNDP